MTALTDVNPASMVESDQIIFIYYWEIQIPLTLYAMAHIATNLILLKIGMRSEKNI